MSSALLLAALLAGPASAGESPEARAAREALQPYAQSFGIRLLPLSFKKEDDFRSTNVAYLDEKEKFYQLRDCFADGKEETGACKHGDYLTKDRFKAAYDAANQTDGKVDHRKGAAWFCHLLENSRKYFLFYHTTYHGTPVSAVEFGSSVTNAEAARLKDAYGIDLAVEARYGFARCEEELVEDFKRESLIPPEKGPDEATPAEPEPSPRAPDAVYRTVDDLKRLQGEGNRFMWFSSTLWGPWLKDVDTLAALLDCRGPRWVGTFVGVVPRDSAYNGGMSFHGRAVRHADQPKDFKSIDWAKVNAPERKKACKELGRKLKR